MLERESNMINKRTIKYLLYKLKEVESCEMKHFYIQLVQELENIFAAIYMFVRWTFFL